MRQLTALCASVFACLLLALPASAAVQEGLVNVNVEDNTILVPIAIAANVCDVTVAALATDLEDGTATCDALATSNATVTEPTSNSSQTRQNGLVNVNVEDLILQLPIAAAANVCDVNVVVLATAILLNDATTCTADADAAGITSAPTGGPGGGPTRQEGLVNVNVEDNTILVPIAIAANVCDVTVAVLATDLQDGEATCDAFATSDATVTEPTNNGGPTRQNGLVNVNISDLIVQVPIALAANICDVDVVVLASAILLNDATTCTADAGAEGITNTPTGGGGGGGPAVLQEGLVNLNVADNTILVPIAVAANVCDVTVAVLVSGLLDGPATCDALATSDATATLPTDNSQATRQNGLVNVNIEDLLVQVPVAVAANICDVDVVVLASAILLNDATSCTASSGAEGIA